MPASFVHVQFAVGWHGQRSFVGRGILPAPSHVQALLERATLPAFYTRQAYSPSLHPDHSYLCLSAFMCGLLPFLCADGHPGYCVERLTRTREDSRRGILQGLQDCRIEGAFCSIRQNAHTKTIHRLASKSVAEPQNPRIAPTRGGLFFMLFAQNCLTRSEMRLYSCYWKSLISRSPA